MSEEIRNPGAELNEAELADVSGGSQPPVDASCLNYANKFCGSCKYTNGCNRWKELARYISENGYLGNHSQCPFYNTARKA